MSTVATNTWPSACGRMLRRDQVGDKLYVGLERAVRRAKIPARCWNALVLPWKRAIQPRSTDDAIERFRCRVQVDLRRNSRHGMVFTHVSAQGRKSRFSHKFNSRQNGVVKEAPGEPRRPRPFLKRSGAFRSIGNSFSDSNVGRLMPKAIHHMPWKTNNPRAGPPRLSSSYCCVASQPLCWRPRVYRAARQRRTPPPLIHLAT